MAKIMEMTETELIAEIRRVRAVLKTIESPYAKKDQTKYLNKLRKQLQKVK